jgi:pyrimidine-specific ribonucleoside hydrolase
MYSKLISFATSLLICFQLHAKTPLIIDTDMGFDDWVAILYVLQNKDIEVKAITIDCNGLTRCPQGGVNAAKLALLVNQHVPIYLGTTDESITDYEFPKSLRDYSTDMPVPGFTHLPTYAIDRKSAAQAIVELSLDAQRQAQPLTIISIGTAVNLADSIFLAKGQGQFDKMSKGIKRIYKAGGAFGLTLLDDNSKPYLSNYNIQGNLTIPGIFASNNTMAEWNIYAAVNAMQSVLQSKLAITWVSINASDMAHITPQAIAFLERHAKDNPSLQFTVNAAKQVVDYQGGWDNLAGNFDFWDTAATIAALNEDVVSESYHNIPLCLLEKQDKYRRSAQAPSFIDGEKAFFHLFKPFKTYFYGASLVGDACKEVGAKTVSNDVIKAIDVKRFYQHFAKMS